MFPGGDVEILKTGGHQVESEPPWVKWLKPVKTCTFDEEENLTELDLSLGDDFWECFQNLETLVIKKQLILEMDWASILNGILCIPSPFFRAGGR